MPPVPKIKHVRQKHFLKEWRKYRGLTQEAMAERVDLDRTSYGRIENGISPYNQDFLELAADALRCSVADLLVRNPLDDSAPWSILDSLRKVREPEDRKRILQVVRALTGTDS